MISIDELRTVEEKNLALEELDPRRDSELIAKIKNLKSVKLVLAVKPTPGILDLIDAFFWQNFKKKVLSDIEVDPNIIGGARIFFGGRFADHSLLKKINEKI